MGGYEKNTVESILDKLAANSVRKENGCLECDFTPSNRYPLVKIDGKFFRVARLVYAVRRGVEIPEGMYICHTCDNTRCIEYLHLYMGTPKQNSADRELRGRSNPQSGEDHWTSRNPQLIQRGSSHSNVRLKEQDIREIRRLWSTGVDQTTIGEMFGVTRGYVSLVVTRRRWSHVE